MEQLAMSLIVEDFESFSVPLLVTLAVLLFAIYPIRLIVRWVTYRERLTSQTITAEYEPPLGLRPAEFAYLFSSFFKRRIIASVVIDLLQRDILILDKTGERTTLRVNELNQEDVSLYQRIVIEEVRNNPGTTIATLERATVDVRLDDKVLPKTPLVKAITMLLDTELERKRYIQPGASRSFLRMIIKFAFVLMVTCLWLPLAFTWLSSMVTDGAFSTSVIRDYFVTGALLSLVLLPLFLLLSFGLQTLKAFLFGREWLATRRMLEFWPSMIGYQHFVRLTGRNKLYFQSKNLENESRHNTLPYRVALGYERHWRKLVN